jgi:hypothetical protein
LDRIWKRAEDQAEEALVEKLISSAFLKSSGRADPGFLKSTIRSSIRSEPVRKQQHSGVEFVRSLLKKEFRLKM